MDQQQNHIISLTAVFLALGIGILIGASMGEKALVLHQIAFIEELKNEISHYKDEIDAQFHSFSQLQEELLLWESLEERYFNPLLLENKLKNIEVKVIALEYVEEELVDFLQKSGCTFLTLVFKETGPHEGSFIMPDNTKIFIVSGYPDSFLASFLENLKRQGKFIIQVADKDNALNVTGADASFPIIYNIDKFYNKIRLLELIQEYNIQEVME